MPVGTGGREQARVDLHLGCVRQDDGPLDHVLKFSDVPRPGVLDQTPQGALFDLAARAFQVEAVLLDEMAYQKWNIFGTVAKSRDGDGKHIQPVKKIWPESFFRNYHPEIRVRRGDDPHVHWDRLAAAYSVDESVLKHAEQFGLRLEGEFADFVQKKRAAVCQFKPSLPSLVRAGERPAFVAEEFAFDEALRQRRAVHAHKGLVPSCAPLVNRACQQLLAGTSLPGDQDRGIRRGYSLRQPHDFLKRLALSYHDAKVVCESDLFHEVLVLFRELLAEAVDLLVRPDVIDREGNLNGHLLEELQDLGLRFAGLHTADVQRAQAGPTHQEREIDHAPQTFLEVDVILQKEARDVQIRPHVELFMVIDPSDRAADVGDHGVALKDFRREARLDRVQSEGVAVSVVQCHPGSLPRDDLFNLFGDRAPEAIRVVLRIEDVRDFQQYAVAEVRPIHCGIPIAG